MAEKARVRLFIDFWNLQLNWNEFHTKAGIQGVVPIPWKDLPGILTAEVAKGQPVKFTGAHVYSSVDQSNPRMQNLITGFITCLPAIRVTLWRYADESQGDPFVVRKKIAIRKLPTVRPVNLR
jgi:hypothetical protein